MRWRLILLLVLVLGLTSPALATVATTQPGVSCDLDPRFASPRVGLDYCFQSTTNDLRHWTGTAWEPIPSPVSSGVSSLNLQTGAVSILGVANQTGVVSGGGSVTIGAAQDIAASSSPTFFGLTLSSLLTGCLQSTAGVVVSTGSPCGGGGGGGVSAVNGLSGALALLGTANRVTVSSVGTTITLSGPQDLGTGSSPTFLSPTVTNLSATNVTTNSLVAAGSVSGRITDTGEQVYNVKAPPFNAVCDGVANDGPAIRATVAAAAAASKGVVFIPAGSCVVSAAAGDPSVTGVFVPENVTVQGAGMASRLVPGTNNMAVFRATGSNAKIRDLWIDNSVALKTGVSAIRVASATEGTEASSFQAVYTVVENVHIWNTDEGVVLVPGLKVGATDQAIFYNRFTGVFVEGAKRCFWFKAPTGGVGSGANANWILGGRCGGGSMNTGLQVDSGSTNWIDQVSFEGISVGVSTNAVPTAIKVAADAAGASGNRLVRVRLENNTRDLDNASTTLEVVEGFGDTNVVVGTAPLLQVAVDTTRLGRAYLSKGLAVGGAQANLPDDVSVAIGTGSVSSLYLGHVPGSPRTMSIRDTRNINALEFINANAGYTGTVASVQTVRDLSSAFTFLDVIGNITGFNKHAMTLRGDGQIVFPFGPLGVGTSAPAVAGADIRGASIISTNTAALPIFPGVLQVAGANSSQVAVVVDSFAAGLPDQTQSALILRSSGGTPTSRSAMPAGKALGAVIGEGAYDGTSYSGSQASLGMFAAENWDATHLGTFLTVGCTFAGTTTLVECARFNALPPVSGAQPTLFVVARNGTTSRPAVTGNLTSVTLNVTGGDGSSGGAAALCTGVTGAAGCLFPLYVMGQFSDFTTTPGAGSTSNVVIDAIRHLVTLGGPVGSASHLTYAEYTGTIGTTTYQEHYGPSSLAVINPAAATATNGVAFIMNASQPFIKATINNALISAYDAQVVNAAAVGTNTSIYGMRITNGVDLTTNNLVTATAGLFIAARNGSGAGVETWVNAIQHRDYVTGTDRFLLRNTGGLFANMPAGTTDAAVDLSINGTGLFKVSSTGVMNASLGSTPSGAVEFVCIDANNQIHRRATKCNAN